jgi:hypothetical protein
MVLTRSQKKQYNHPVQWEVLGYLDDGSEVLITITTKRGETLEYTYRGRKFYKADRFIVNQIRKTVSSNKMVRYDCAQLDSSYHLKEKNVYYGENIGNIRLYHRLMEVIIHK